MPEFTSHTIRSRTPPHAPHTHRAPPPPPAPNPTIGRQRETLEEGDAPTASSLPTPTPQPTHSKHSRGFRRAADIIKTREAEQEEELCAPPPSCKIVTQTHGRPRAAPREFGSGGLCAPRRAAEGGLGLWVWGLGCRVWGVNYNRLYPRIFSKSERFPVEIVKMLWGVLKGIALPRSAGIPPVSLEWRVGSNILPQAPRTCLGSL